MAIYHIGEHKVRPGVYRRIVDRGEDTSGLPVSAPVLPDIPDIPDIPDEPQLMTVAYAAGVVTITLPKGGKVSYEDNGIVTIGG